MMRFVPDPKDPHPDRHTVVELRNEAELVARIVATENGVTIAVEPGFKTAEFAFNGVRGFGLDPREIHIELRERHELLPQEAAGS